MGKVPPNFLVAFHYETNSCVTDLANLAVELTWKAGNSYTLFMTLA